MRASFLPEMYLSIFAAAVAAAPKRKVSFGAEMSPAKVGWHGSSTDCSEAEEEESIYSEEESGSEAADDF